MTVHVRYLFGAGHVQEADYPVPANSRSTVAVHNEVPANVDQVSLLGETLDALTPAGHETSVMPGRPVAVVSNILFEYKPPPVKTSTKKKR